MKKKTLLLGIILSLALCGCDNSAKQTASEGDYTEASRSIFAMDTYMTLKAYGSTAEIALGESQERIVQLEDILCVTDEDSEVYKINHSNGDACSVSPDTSALLRAAVEYGDKTNGALDITLYPVLSLWGFTRDTQQIPSTEELQSTLAMTDYRKIFVSGNTACVPDNVQLDFGALAKGYTGDSVMEILKSNGITSALVNLGGNVQALGCKPDGSPWKVAVQNPQDNSQYICVLEISDLAVITSGSYERYFVGEDGERYWHIIDPSDGYPADNGLVSVTVVGTSGLMCDALSTALFVMGTDRAIEYWHNEGGFEMILVTDSGEIYYTNGLQNIIEFTEQFAAGAIMLQ